ncbi:DNA primase [Lacticigenium naphthae]|uniref:DNA primase n=1 Tax=Lacticigenium naphthae TaxID=515351 RepID=UPI0004081C92|nr:DNA primase [Lacticigenium naphthae]
MRIPEETVQSVLTQTNIVDVISQYVQLKKQGKNLFGSCPFHEERTPSFSVNEEKQMYHCFSCGRGGNAYSFLMEIDGLSFPEAVVKTAEVSGLSIDEKYSQMQHDGIKEDSIAAKLLRMHNYAREFYQHLLLNTTTGEAALNYLYDRGLTKETIETFAIGYSPSKKTVLKQFLDTKEAFTSDELQKSGLFADREGEWLDRFAGRIIFPIENDRGKTVAFSGRLFVVEDSMSEHAQSDYTQPKYLNSPETVLFNKRKILFNYANGRSEIRRKKEAILFEGFMDVISSYQAGIKHGLASMGTSLTNEHIQLLDKVTDHIVLAFDGDQAGLNAAKKVGEIFRDESPFAIEIIQFPEGLDPDDFIKKRGKETYSELITHGRNTFMGFLMDYYRQELNLANESEQFAYIEQILKELVLVPSAIQRETYINQLAEEFSVSKNSLTSQFEQYTRENRQIKRQQRQKNTSSKEVPIVPQVRTQQAKLTQTERAEQFLFYRLTHSMEVFRHIQNLEDFHFVHEEYQLLYYLFESFISDKEEFSLSLFLEYIKDKELKEKAVRIEWISLESEYTMEEIQDYIAIISTKDSLEEELKVKQLDMKKAAQRKDTAAQHMLMTEIIQLSRQLKNTN